MRMHAQSCSSETLCETLVHQTREDRVRWTLQIQLGGLGEWPIVEYVLVITYINQRLRSSVS